MTRGRLLSQIAASVRDFRVDLIRFDEQDSERVLIEVNSSRAGFCASRCLRSGPWTGASSSTNEAPPTPHEARRRSLWGRKWRSPWPGPYSTIRRKKSPRLLPPRYPLARRTLLGEGAGGGVVVRQAHRRFGLTPIAPPSETRTPRKDRCAKDHNAPSHISKMVPPTIHLGPPFTPKTFGDSNFSDESSSSWADLHRVMTRWSKCTPQRGVQLGAHPLSIIAFHSLRPLARPPTCTVDRTVFEMWLGAL